MKKEANLKLSKFFSNPWVEGIGVTIIGGLILYFVFGVGSPATIQSPSRSAISDSSLASSSAKQDDRQPNTLRALEPLETNKEMSKLPDGIYGYAYAFNIARFIQNDTNSLTLTNQPDKYKFEIQKNNDETLIVGFVDETTFSKVGEITKTNPSKVVVFPINWKKDKRLVLIPIKSFIDVTDREIDIDQWTRISILEGTILSTNSGNGIKIYRNDSN